MLESFWLYQAAFAAQVFAALCYLAYAFRPYRAMSKVATFALALAAAAQTVFYLALGLRLGRLPLGHVFEALNLWVLCLTWATLALEWQHRLGLLGAFLTPLTTYTLLMGFSLRFAPVPTTPAISGAFMLAHVSLAMLAFAAFTAAAGLGFAYLVQERQLRSKSMGPWIYDLPALEGLDNLAGRGALVGWLALTVSLGVGALGLRDLGAGIALGAPKLAFSLGVWALYGLLLLGRRGGAWRGRRGALALAVGFLVLTLGFYLVNKFLGGHGMGA